MIHADTQTYRHISPKLLARFFVGDNDDVDDVGDGDNVYVVHHDAGDTGGDEETGQEHRV